MFDRPARPGLPAAWSLLRRSLHLLGLLVVLVVVVAFAVFAVPQLAGAEHSYVVLSGSMHPTMNPGDVILVDAVGIDAVETGDIVTYRSAGGTTTTHRVVGVVTDGETVLQTKGDDNEAADPRLVGESALLGRVMTLAGTPVVIPYVGLVIESARTDLGLYALVFVPLTLFVLNEFYTRLAGSPGEADGEPVVDPLSVRSNGGGDHPVAAHVFSEGLSQTFPGASSLDSGPSSSTASGSRPPGLVALRPVDIRLTPLVVFVLAGYSGWVALTSRSVPAWMVFAGATVTFVLLGISRIQLWRLGLRVTSPGALSRRDVSVALFVSGILTAFSLWQTLDNPSVPSAMVAAGGGIGVALLAIVRFQLRRTMRHAGAVEELIGQ